MERPPVVIALVGRSGSGKTTLARHLLPLFAKEKARMLTSTTTRIARQEAPLPLEYEHVPLHTFEEMDSGGQFAWTTKVAETHYGTRKTYLDDAAHTGISLSIITPDYMQRLHHEISLRNVSARVLHLYVSVPNEEVLRQRLLHRDGNVSRLAIDRHWPEKIKQSGIKYQSISGELCEEKIVELAGALIESVYYSYY